MQRDEGEHRLEAEGKPRKGEKGQWRGKAYEGVCKLPRVRQCELYGFLMRTVHLTFSLFFGVGVGATRRGCPH